MALYLVSAIVEMPWGLGLIEEMEMFERLQDAIDAVERLKRDRSVRTIVLTDEEREEILYEWSREAMLEPYDIERGK